MHLEVNIAGNVLGGALAGAIVAMSAIAVIAALSAIAQSIPNFGYSGGFLKMFAKGCLIYVPVGTVAGGVISGAGLPWWTAIPTVVMMLVGLHLFERERYKRRFL